jgi:hypothetical protein
VRDGSDILYSDNLMDNCKHCFGCVGLKTGEYCIFNKQYTKEEYEITVAKIIEHMQTTGERGEFFHPSLSPFGYNETVAQEYLPVKKSELPIQHGYKWSDYSLDPKMPENAECIKAGEMDDASRERLKDDPEITKKVFLCSVSGRPFILQKGEVAFYKKHNLPLPHKHYDIRHQERMKMRP